MKSMKESLISGLKSVSTEWKKAKLKSERVSKQKLDSMRYKEKEDTMKELVWGIMEEAYNKASSNGKFFANARQIMYQARALVKNVNQDVWGKDATFQPYLKEYILEKQPTWKTNVVWSAKGNFIEPHTKKKIGLGGVEVREYHEKWKDDFGVLEELETKKLIKTKGATNRFNTILFIEKEGFTEILMKAGVFEKYDMAFISTKGLPTDACCDLNKWLSVEKNVRIFTLRDFDLAGFKIVNTLKNGTQLTDGSKLVDIGLRLEDVKDMKLESEPVNYRQIKNPKIILEEYGATKEEQEFLVSNGGYKWWSGRRVELNMMTSEQLVAFIERKLDENGVKKIFPHKPILENAYTRAIYLQRIDEEGKKIRKQMLKDGIKIPETLEEEVKKHLENNNKNSWDGAIWEIAKEREAVEDEL